MLFNGSATQTISGATAFANLRISNPADVTLLGPVSISDTLTLRAGHLVVDNQALTLGPDATIAGADASRYLITRDDPAGLGYVLRPLAATDAAVSFPVGTAASYAPVLLRNQGAAVAIKVRAFSGLREHGTSGAPYASASSFVNQAWDLSPTTIGAVVDATLQWPATAENPSFQRAAASVFHNDNTSSGTWAALPSTTATGPNPYQLTATGVRSFSTFAVGSAAPLPVALVGFGARRTSATVVAVSWATASERNCAHFEVERSADGQQFQALGAVPCSGATAPYAFRDEAAAGAAYYRLRQVDTDGTASYSAPVYVAASATDGLALSIFPNPTAGTVTLLGAPASAVLTLSLSSPLGQLLLPPSTAALPELTARLNAALASCAPGVYILTAESNGRRQHLKVVKH